MKKGVKRSRQVLVISSIVLVVAAVIVASTAYPLGQREITKTTTETVLKTETQSATITSMMEGETKTETSYSTIQTTISTTITDKTTIRTTIPKPTTIKDVWKDASFAVFIPIPREVNQAYVQRIENFSIGSNIVPMASIPLTDGFGNNYTVPYWNEEIKSTLVVTLTVILYKNFDPNILAETSPHPYPVTDNLIPDDVKKYLKPPTGLEIDFNHPDIIALTDSLAKNSNDQAEVVKEVVRWVFENIKYDYGLKVHSQHSGRWGPIETLKYRYGICLDFAQLTAVLLIRKGIPCRLVFDAFPHAWIQVYYPKVGWINYDSGKGPSPIPHIDFCIESFELIYGQFGVDRRKLIRSEEVIYEYEVYDMQWNRVYDANGERQWKLKCTLVFTPKTS